MKKLKILFYLSTIIIFFFYFLTNNIIGKENFKNIKSYFSDEQKYFVKKYFFPYKLIDELNEKNFNQNNIISKLDLIDIEINFKKSLKKVLVNEKIEKLDEGLILKKYNLQAGFYSGIWNEYPGSGFIEFHNDNMIVLSSRGVIIFSDRLEDKKKFFQIKNNINNFINYNQFKKNKWFSVKDLLINENKIFVSYTKEIKKNCWNTSILYAEMNYEDLEFQEFYSPDECIHSINNIDNEFNAFQSGGRMVNYKDNIVLSLGDYRNRSLGQKIDSVNGKIISINKNDFTLNTLSMGHRNPQGLFFDIDKNILIESEHGPQGGDEINIIKLKENLKSKIPNFGWPIASYGEHYGGKIKKNETKYKKYPLLKSHTKNGYIEPKKIFKSSVGISQVAKVTKNIYIVGALKSKSLYLFELDNLLNIINFTEIKVHERIRDIFFYKKNLYLFLEDTASIGLINFEKFY